ncbi:MAG: beta-propeller domain-containing protein [Labilithrix sp.]
MNVCRSFALGLVLATVACGSSSSSSPALARADAELAGLVPMACGDLDTFARASVVEQMNRFVDREIARLGPEGGCADPGSGDDDDDLISATTSSDSASRTSTTNNQVANVDEADFVKNDDRYIYAAVNGTFQIVEAYPAPRAKEVARVPLEGEPRKLFVDGDRAVVYLAMPRSSSGAPESAWYSTPAECRYGFDCVPRGDNTATKIVVLDISDRTAPLILRQIETSGSYLAARRIGHAVHTVLVNELSGIPGLLRYPQYLPADCSTEMGRRMAYSNAVQSWEALRLANLEAIAKAAIHAELPSFRENGGPAAEPCDGLYRPSIVEGTTFTTLMSFDLTQTAVPKTATIMGDPGVVYASDSSLYMSVPQARAPGRGLENGEMSLVHQFAIGEDPRATSYLASGAVKGRVIGQFALDEFQGHLRIATTSGRTPDPDVHSTLSVLRREGNALRVTGAVDHIAPTEDIRSVRFEGTRGFVVTFKKTDPLFAFDLSNPTAPQLTGEVQVPGFSTYIHMMDDTHLLTIGYDADDQGDFAWFAGVRLQIFDVADMKAPRLLHAEVIGTRGTSSEALVDHLAFNYHAPKNILALPMTICQGGEVGSFGTDMTFSGLLVYDVTVDGGFHLRGQVAHPNVETGNGWDSEACMSWWTNARSEVKRSIVMDDFIYSVSERRVKASSLSNLGVDLADVSLENLGWQSPLRTGGGD